jgi:hypothetical protein
MNLEDTNLQDAIDTLSGRDREAIEAQVRGQASAAGLQILQSVKAKLKRKARAGKPRKIQIREGKPGKKRGSSAGRGVNSTAIRNAKIAAATKAEETAARRDYEAYKQRLAKIHAPVEAWPLYFAEWLDTRRAEAIEGDQCDAADQYERRNYSVIYRSAIDGVRE